MVLKSTRSGTAPRRLRLANKKLHATVHDKSPAGRSSVNTKFCMCERIAINRQSLLVLASSISGRPDVSKAVDAG